MSIIIAGKEFRTLSDEFFVNGKKVIEAYLGDGTKVYPEEEEYEYVLSLYGQAQFTYRGSHGTSTGETVSDNKVVNISVVTTIKSEVPITVYDGIYNGYRYCVAWPAITTTQEAEAAIGKKVAVSTSVDISAPGTPTPPIEDWSTYNVSRYDHPGALNSCSELIEVEGAITRQPYPRFIDVPWSLDAPSRNPNGTIDGLSVDNKLGVPGSFGSRWVASGVRVRAFYDHYTITDRVPPYEETRSFTSFVVNGSNIPVGESTRVVSYQNYEWVKRPGQEG